MCKACRRAALRSAHAVFALLPSRGCADQMIWEAVRGCGGARQSFRSGVATGSDKHARQWGYLCLMRRWICAPLAAVSALACSEPQVVPPKRPNPELIVGEYERHPPEGETAVRFRAD